MTRLEIVNYPNRALRLPNKIVERPVDYFDLVRNMIYTMRLVKGVGLAAPQIGENIMIAVALIDKKPIVVFNPEIIDGSPGGEPFKEGCLSLPGVSVVVGRPRWVDVKYFDLKGRWHVKRFEDLNCVIICHEIDHLNGILIIDHEKKENQNGNVYN